MPCQNAMNIDNSQKDIAARVIQVGDARGFTDQMINFALKSAFIESSLGNMVGPPSPGSDHIGLYQYDAVSWRDLGHTGERNNIDNQINAFYDDIIKYTTRYNNLVPADRGNLSLEQYIYLKHHDGNNATNWSTSEGVNKFNNTCFDMAVDTHNPDTQSSSGSIGMPTYYFPILSFGWDDLPQGTVTVGPLQPVPPPGEDGDGE